MPSDRSAVSGAAVTVVAASPDTNGDGGVLWDDFARRWLASGAQKVWRRHSDAVNRRMLERWLPPQADQVLKTDLWDEAVGEGLYPALATRARRVVGVDISTAVISAATARYPSLEASRADVRNLQFDDGSFDVVVSNSTLDHFESVDAIQTALVELRRVMSKGGTLIVTLDNAANPILALRGALPRAAFAAVWTHFGELAARIAPNALGATCGIRTLERLVMAAGLRVCERGAIMHCPRALAVVVADQLARRASASTQERFLRSLLRFEALAVLPTRFFTGHFVAVRAVR